MQQSPGTFATEFMAAMPHTISNTHQPKKFQFGPFSRNDLKDLAKNNLLAITLSKLSHRQITGIQKSCYLC